MNNRTVIATHALLIMMRSETEYTSLSEIIKRAPVKISISYLEQIMAGLTRAKIVKTARGPGGGSKLATSPDLITIDDIKKAANYYHGLNKRTGADKVARFIGFLENRGLDRVSLETLDHEVAV